MNNQTEVIETSRAEGQFRLNAGLGWQPINTAPEGRPVVVGWREADDGNSERHDFDIKEDGIWVRHEDHVEYAQAVAPRDIPCTMPSAEAPYTCWMYLPPIPGMPNVKLTGGLTAESEKTNE